MVVVGTTSTITNTYLVGYAMSSSILIVLLLLLMIYFAKPRILIVLNHSNHMSRGQMSFGEVGRDGAAAAPADARSLAPPPPVVSRSASLALE